MEREPSRRRFLTGCYVAGAGALAAGGLAGGAAAQGATRADPPETRWDRTYEQGTSAQANAVVPANDDDGFVVVGTVEPGDSDVESEVWLYKINAAGQRQWDRTFGERPVTAGFDIVAASDGYMVAGHTSDPAEEGQDAFALRVGNDGSETWRRAFNANPSTTDTMRSVDVDDQGRFVFAGWTSRFDDAWVARLSGPESIDWAETYGPGQHNRYHGILAAEQGGYVVVGETDDNDDDTVGWATKLAEDGTQQFSQQFKKRSDSATNPYDDFNVFYDVAETRNGFVAVGANAFDPKTNDQNGWALEFNVNGGKLWDKRYSEDNFTVLRSVTDGNLEYYVAGETGTTGDGQDARGYAANLGIEGEIKWKGTWGSGSSGFSSFQLTDAEGMVCLGRQADSAGAATDGWGVKIGGDPVPTDEPTPTPTASPTPSGGDSTPTFTPTPTGGDGGTVAAGDGTDTPAGGDGSDGTDAQAATPTDTPGGGDGADQGTTAAGDGGGGISPTTIGIGAIILALGGGGLLYNRYIAGGEDDDVAGPGAGTGGAAPMDSGDGGDGGDGDGGADRTEPSDDGGEVQQAQTVVEGSEAAADADASEGAEASAGAETGDADGAGDEADSTSQSGDDSADSETGEETTESDTSDETAESEAGDETAESDADSDSGESEAGDDTDTDSDDDGTSKSGTGAGGQR